MSCVLHDDDIEVTEDIGLDGVQPVDTGKHGVVLGRLEVVHHVFQHAKKILFFFSTEGLDDESIVIAEKEEATTLA